MFPIRSVVLLILAVYLEKCLAVGFYDKHPHVQELTSSNFDDVVYGTNYTTVVEFYAPWCGHCQSLKPHYKKVGAASEGIFQAAAVNCDEQMNKQLCASMQIQGYPTVMVFRPPKYDLDDAEKNLKNAKNLKHASEIYNGPRTFQDITTFVTSRIKNYVKRINNETNLLKFMSGKTKANKNKLLILTEKSKASPMVKAIAIDYLEDLEVAFAQIKDDAMKQAAFKHLNISEDASLPQVVVIDKRSSEEDLIDVYNGKIDKNGLYSYLTNFGTPSEGPDAKKAKSKQRKPKKTRKQKMKDRDEL